MIDLSPVAIMLIMFSALVVVLVSGLPVVFTMGSIGVVLLLLVWGPQFLPMLLVANSFAVMNSYVLVAVPQFVFMALILRGSGIVDDLFASIRFWLAPVPGGLAMAVVAVCVFVAAMSGVTLTGILILGIIAVPMMLKYGYSKELALGSVMAGAGLANLIPPSNGFIVYGAIAGQSVGQLFIGGIVPGLILAALFAGYIFIRCTINPSFGPPVPKEERVGWRTKISSMRSLVLPLALIIAVLGSIFMGVVAATEAASIGAVGSLICAAVKRKLNWQLIKSTLPQTLTITSMVVWIFIGAFCFKSVFIYSGGPQFVADWVTSLNIHSLVIVGIMQVAFMILGMFVSEAAIMLISLPPFLPIVDALGLSRLWFGVLMLTNLQMCLLTPPFGGALFYMRSVAPEGVTMTDIIRSIFPFIPLIIIATLLVMFIPELATWLPGLMLG